MDVKELIAEARKRAEELKKYAWMAKRDVDREEMRLDAELYANLADALEQATPPEGWRVTEYTYGVAGAEVMWMPDNTWLLTDQEGNLLAENFPTAREAMAALEATDSKTPASD